MGPEGQSRESSFWKDYLEDQRGRERQHVVGVKPRLAVAKHHFECQPTGNALTLMNV